MAVAPDKLLGVDTTTKDEKAVVVGSGLQLTAGVLSATGTIVTFVSIWKWGID